MQHHHAPRQMKPHRIGKVATWRHALNRHRAAQVSRRDCRALLVRASQQAPRYRRCFSRLDARVTLRRRRCHSHCEAGCLCCSTWLVSPVRHGSGFNYARRRDPDQMPPQREHELRLAAAAAETAGVVSSPTTTLFRFRISSQNDCAGHSFVAVPPTVLDFHLQLQFTREEANGASRLASLPGRRCGNAQ